MTPARPKAARFAALALAALLAAGSPTPGHSSSAPFDDRQVAAFERAPLRIATAAGERCFNVEIAADAERQRRGLMDRAALAPDAGMLFLFGADRRRSFWMHNTHIPLDMIFIRSDGVIVAIVENAEPDSEDIISPVAFAASVLEVNGGTARKLGIKTGDKVQHPAIAALENGWP